MKELAEVDWTKNPTVETPETPEEREAYETVMRTETLRRTRQTMEQARRDEGARRWVRVGKLLKVANACETTMREEIEVC